MKKQTPEKEPEQGVTAEFSAGYETAMTEVIDHKANMAIEAASARATSLAFRRENTLRQYRCASLTGILAGTNFTGAMEDMVVIARKIGLLMLEADEKEAAADVV